MFEFPAFLPATNLGLPMHSPSALTEHVPLNLARFFLLDPAMLVLKIGRYLIPICALPLCSVYESTRFTDGDSYCRYDVMEIGFSDMCLSKVTKLSPFVSFQAELGHLNIVCKTYQRHPKGCTLNISAQMNA